MAVQQNLQYSNFYATTLASDAGAGDSTISVSSASDLPSISAGQHAYIVLTRASDNAREIMKVTGISGTTLTVTRAQDNTTALAFLAGDVVRGSFVSAHLDDIKTELLATVDSFMVADASAADQSDDSVANTIAKIASDASNKATIFLPAGTYTFGAAYIVQPNIKLVFMGNAKLSIASAVTVYIKGGVEAGAEEIFTGSGTVEMTNGQDVLAEWYGAAAYATTGEGSPVDSGAKLATAFDNTNGRVILGTTGYYYVSTTANVGNGDSAAPDQLVINPGAILYGNGVTPNLYCEVVAGRQKIFETAMNKLMNRVISPEWFGAVRDGTTSAHTAIERSLSCGFTPTSGVAEPELTVDCGGGDELVLSATITINTPVVIRNGTLRCLSGHSGQSLFSITPDADGTRFEGMSLRNSKTSTDMSGIYAYDTDHLVVDGCHFDSFRGAVSSPQYDGAISLQNCDKATIRDCYIASTLVTSIVTQDCDHCQILDTVIASNGTGAAIDIWNGNDVKVSGCHIQTSSGEGIRAVGYSSGGAELNGVIISNCTIRAVSKTAILLDGSTNPVKNVNISGNVIVGTNTSYAGIKVEGDDVIDVIASLNNVEAFAHGVYVQDGSNVLVLGNHLMGCVTESYADPSLSNIQIINNMKGVVTINEALAIIVDKKNVNTNGQSLSASTWTTRELTDIEADTGGFVTGLSSNVISLKAGTYKIVAHCPVGNGPNNTQSRIYDVTNSQVVGQGLTVEGGNNDTFNFSTAVGILSADSATDIRIETIVSGSGRTGSAWNESDLDNQIFTIVEIVKISDSLQDTTANQGLHHRTFHFDVGSGVAAATGDGTMIAIGQLPDNSTVTNCWIEGVVAMASSGTPDIKLSIDNGDVLLVATAHSTFTTASQTQGAPDGSVLNFLTRTDGVKDVLAHVIGTPTTEDLTAGKIAVHITFTTSED